MEAPVSSPCARVRHGARARAPPATALPPSAGGRCRRRRRRRRPAAPEIRGRTYTSMRMRMCNARVCFQCVFAHHVVKGKPGWRTCACVCTRACAMHVSIYTCIACTKIYAHLDLARGDGVHVHVCRHALRACYACVWLHVHACMHACMHARLDLARGDGVARRGVVRVLRAAPAAARAPAPLVPAAVEVARDGGPRRVHRALAPRLRGDMGMGMELHMHMHMHTRTHWP